MVLRRDVAGVRRWRQLSFTRLGSSTQAPGSNGVVQLTGQATTVNGIGVVRYVTIVNR